MKLIDYKQLNILAKCLGLNGDFTTIQNYFSKMDNDFFISTYRTLRKEMSAMETTKCLSQVVDLVGFKLNEDLLKTLTLDKGLMKYLRNKKISHNIISDTMRLYLKGYDLNDIKEEPVINKVETDEIFIFKGFIFDIDGEKTKLFFPNEEYVALKKYCRNRDRQSVRNFFANYDIDADYISFTKPTSLRIHKETKDKIVEALTTGIMNSSSYYFLGCVNRNNALFSKNELSKGVNTKKIERIFNNSIKITKQVNIEETIADLPSHDDKKIKKMGVQKLFIGQGTSVCSIFNITDLSSYILNIPNNKFVYFDDLTGDLIPVMQGTVKISIENIFDNQVKEITLSVCPSIRSSINTYISGKKKLELTNKKDNQ